MKEAALSLSTYSDQRPGGGRADRGLPITVPTSDDSSALWIRLERALDGCAPSSRLGVRVMRTWAFRQNRVEGEMTSCEAALEQVVRIHGQCIKQADVCVCVW